MRYVLDICEIVTMSHRVIIDTDKDIDAVCNEIESRVYGINSVWDIDYIDGVTLVNVDEDEDGDWEFEVEGVDDEVMVEEQADDVIDKLMAEEGSET